MFLYGKMSGLLPIKSETFFLTWQAVKTQVAVFGRGTKQRHAAG
jgi:hypothetical protein